MTQPRAKTTPASTAGSFTAKTQSDPSGGLSLKQLGIIGLGPDSENRFATHWDNRDDRPLRRSLALLPADDDEFFDAREGVVLNIAEGRERTLWRKLPTTKTDGQWAWANTETGEELESGELWASLFDEEGRMAPSQLLMPVGVGFSTRAYYTELKDEPRDADWAREQLAGGKARMAELALLERGEVTSSGAPDGNNGADKLDVTFTDYGAIRIGAGRGLNREWNLDAVEIFERRGNVVIRQPLNDEGERVEVVYQPA